jgi:hypothetical protein
MGGPDIDPPPPVPEKFDPIAERARQEAFAAGQRRKGRGATLLTGGRGVLGDETELGAASLLGGQR